MAQKNQPSGYPVQRIVGSSGMPAAQYPSYPTQGNFGGYPTQSYHQPPYNQQYPQPYPQVQQHPGYGQVYSQPYGQPNYGQAPPPYPGVTTNPTIPQPLVQGQFDSGARFGAGASVNIPPPPPGVMPTAGQMAASQGQAVAMQQPKAGWLEGARGGGYTFW